MNKKRSGIKLLFALLVIVAGSLLFYFGQDIQQFVFQNDDNSENEALIEELTQKNQQLEVQLQEIQKSLIEAQEIPSEMQSNDDGERIELLKDFGHKWVNYDSVYERNQSIREYLTEKAIEDNAIDVDPHADFEGVGAIESISRKIGNTDKYILVGSEKTRGQESILIIEVEFAENENEIDSIRVYYVRQIV